MDQCPNCGSTNTISAGGNKRRCADCPTEWYTFLSDFIQSMPEPEDWPDQPKEHDNE